MTTLAGRSEAFELDSKAGSPETLSPLLFGRVAQLYHARLQHRSLLVFDLSPSLALGIGQGSVVNTANILQGRSPEAVRARGCC